MKKIKQSPKRPAEERRRQLMESAQELFVQKGYWGTTTEDIAKRAGLTKGALYFHFKSKEDIMLAIIQGFHTRYARMLKERMSDKMGPLELFQTQWKHLLRERVDRDCDTGELWRQAWRIPRIRRYMRQRARRFRSDLAVRLDTKVISHLGRPEAVVDFIQAVLHGLMVSRMLSPRLVDMSEQEKIIQVLLAPHQRGRRSTRSIKTSRASRATEARK